MLTDMFFAKSFNERREYIPEYGYVKITKPIIDCLVPILKGPVLDVGSGPGYLAFLLEQQGINIHSVDSGLWTGFTKIHHRTFQCDALTMDFSSYQTIILSWPPYDTDIGFRVAQKLKPKQYLLYEGEDDGGCCADDQFFELVYGPEFVDHTVLLKDLNMIHEQFEGMHDHWMLFEKI